jgi:cyclopropane fatty-acyl-phospholipid synthase-like methyltransferase
LAELARVKAAGRVLDVGCGIAAPALRIAHRYGCRVTGVNISREQVRQDVSRSPRACGVSKPDSR